VLDTAKALFFSSGEKLAVAQDTSG
jgi:hypothetical protein